MPTLVLRRLRLLAARNRSNRCKRANLPRRSSPLSHPSALGLVFRPEFLRLDHPRFLPPALLPVAPSFHFSRVDHGGGRGPLAFLQFCAKLLPRQVAIRGLGALPLTSHFDPCRPVPQPNRRAGLVDF